MQQQQKQWTKEEIIAKYIEYSQIFAGLVVPIESTPAPIAISLRETYDYYHEWLDWLGSVAEHNGFWQEMIEAQQTAAKDQK